MPSNSLTCCPKKILTTFVTQIHFLLKPTFCSQVLSVYQIFGTVQQPAANRSQGRPPQGRDGGGSQPHGDLSSQ